MAFDGATPLSTQQLDSTAVSLDARAFGRLWAQQRGRLLGLAARMTGNPADAEDVVQEAFLQAFRARERFAGQSQPSTWLYRIAANAALMHLRSRRRRPLELRGLVGDADVDVTDTLYVSGADEPGPEGAALASERRRAVQGAVARLPERDRELLEALLTGRLDGVDEGTDDDVTTAWLGSASARKSRLARARARLRCDDRLVAVI